MSKDFYVCQRAAHAIIAEIAPLRVSSDALQAINIFIDEFLALLVISASSLDLVRIKTSVIQLLPHSLGKNALVEAEIELKQQIDSEHHDFTMYEKMRSLGNDGLFPEAQVILLLQEACANYCTLAADQKDTDSLRSLNQQIDSAIAIAPVVVIYVTAIVEHIAEYILNSVAMTADQMDAEHIRVKEVLLCLIDDPQVSPLFRRMSLKDKLEKRASTYQNYYTTLPSPAPSPIPTRRDQLIQRHSLSSNHPKDEYEQADDTSSRATPSSNCSMRSSDSISDRPLSIMSNGTVKSSGSKSRFSFFGSSKKEKRSSISLNFSSSRRSNPPSIVSPTTPSYTTATMDFDDLIRSGSTKKVSLTPNRLRSIEVKDEPNEITPWDSSTTTNNSRNKKKTSSTCSSSSIPPPPLPPLPPLPRSSREHHHDINTHHSIPEASTNSPPLTPASSVASRPSQRSRHSIIYEEKSTRSSLKSYSTTEDLLVEETMNLMRNPSKMTISSSLYSNNGRRNTPFGEDAAPTTDVKPPMIKPRFERPSSMVVKRASMGSRPPSFHESALEIMGNTLIATAAGSAEFSSSRALDELRLQYEARRSATPKKILEDDEEEDEQPMTSTSVTSQVEQEHHQRRYQDMIYVIPPPTTIPRSPISNRFSPKARTMDKGCQTDPVRLHSIIDDHKTEEPIDDDDDEEEWFLEEEDWNDAAEEEKIVVEWLLGNV